MNQEEHGNDQRSQYAVAFLILKAPTRNKLHKLQLQSCEILDDNNKKDEEDVQIKGDGSDDEDDMQDNQDGGSANKVRLIDIKKIGATIVGLATYEAKITDDKMKKYKEFMDSHNEPSLGVQTFLIALGLLLINLIGKNIKNNYPEEYLMRKVIESFMLMRATNYETVEGVYDGPPVDGDFYQDYMREKESLQVQSLSDHPSGAGLTSPDQFANAALNNDLYDTIREVQIKNKKELYEYLKYDFSQIYFTEDYVQHRLKLVGPVRLRTVHTNTMDECPISTPLDTCYHKIATEDEP